MNTRYNLQIQYARRRVGLACARAVHCVYINAELLTDSLRSPNEQCHVFYGSSYSLELYKYKIRLTYKLNGKKYFFKIFSIKSLYKNRNSLVIQRFFTLT